MSKLLLGALLVCLAGRTANGAESVPDWLAAAGRVDLNHFGDGSAAVTVGEWTDFTVDSRSYSRCATSHITFVTPRGQTPVPPAIP